MKGQIVVSKRDIVEVPFNLRQGVEIHPAIVLSVEEAIEMEESFIALMLTTSETDDEFSFPIKAKMLSKDLNVPFCQARLHLISFFQNTEIIRNSNYNNRIRTEFFKELIEKVNAKTFGV